MKLGLYCTARSYVPIHDGGDVNGPVRSAKNKTFRPNMTKYAVLLLPTEMSKVFIIS